MPPHQPPQDSPTRFHSGALAGGAPAPVTPPHAPAQDVSIAKTPEIWVRPGNVGKFIVEFTVSTPLVKEPAVRIQSERGEVLLPTDLQADGSLSSFSAEFDQVENELGGLVLIEAYDASGSEVNSVHPFAAFSLEHGGEYSLCGPHNDVCIDFTLGEQKNPFQFCLNQPTAKLKAKGAAIGFAIGQNCKQVPVMIANLPTDLADDPDAERFAILRLEGPNAEPQKVAKDTRFNALVGVCDAEIEGSGVYGLFAVEAAKTVEELKDEVRKLRSLLAQRDRDYEELAARVELPSPASVRRPRNRTSLRHEAW